MLKKSTKPPRHDPSGMTPPIIIIIIKPIIVFSIFTQTFQNAGKSTTGRQAPAQKP